MMGELGAIVLNADQATHEVLEDPEVVRTLTAWWGSSIVAPDGRVDRQRIADIIFEDPAQRRRLEGLIHPRILARWGQVIEQARHRPGFAPAVVIDAPLLFESGLDAECDTILFVDAPEPLRASRVKEDRNWTESELQRREKMQEPLDIKRAKADHIVENNSSVRELRREVEYLFSTITSSGC